METNLLNWTNDLGNCDFARHEINTLQRTSTISRSKRTPRRDMLETEAIRLSTSPFSSNVVVIRKMDSSASV